MSNATERRRAPRQDTMGLVVFATQQGGDLSDAPAYTVGDLSALGALLVGGAQFQSGDRLDMKLEVPGHRSVTVSATVARCFEHGGTTKVGVEFNDLDDDAQVFVQEAILSEIVRKTEPVVLVVATGVSSAIDLWADLDEIGCDARVVPTLDEGFVALHARDLPVSSVLVDVREGASPDTVAFASYAMQNMPSARVMLFGISPESSPIPGVECIPESAWTLRHRQSLFAQHNNVSH